MTTAIYKKLLLLAAFPMLMLASCSKDEITGNPGNNPGDGIRFEIGFASQGSPATRVATDTRFNSTWEEGDQIGVFAVEHGNALASSGNFFHNVKLTYRKGLWKAAETMDWPTDGTKLDFYAYYPYDAETTDPTAITFNVASDQSTSTGGKPNYNRSDLLMAKSDNENQGYASGNTVSLAFKHALAMVQVIVGVHMSNVNVVHLNGCITETTLNLSTQTTASAQTAKLQQVTMYACPNDASTPGIAYRALVPAQTIGGGTSMFRFIRRASSLYQSPKLSSVVPLVAGRAEIFEFSMPYMSVTISPGNSLRSQLQNSDLTAITHLKVSGGMSKKDFDTFAQMSALTILDLSGATLSVKDIPSEALSGKKRLEKFFFPQGITSIGTSAFSGCRSLEELVIPEGVTTIGSFAFNECSSIRELVIPQGVTTIGSAAFSKCSNIRLLVIPEGVTKIENNAFNGCENLTSIHCEISDLSKVTFGSKIFKGVPTGIPVHVPQAAREQYKNHWVWGNFTNFNPKNEY